MLPDAMPWPAFIRECAVGAGWCRTPGLRWIDGKPVAVWMRKSRPDAVDMALEGVEPDDALTRIHDLMARHLRIC